MLEFDDLFAKRDPYRSFTTSLADSNPSDTAANERGLLSLSSTDHATILRELLECRPGKDLREAALGATRSEGILANCQDVHEMVAAHVALALPTLQRGEEFGSWLKKHAAAAVRAVVEEDAEHAKQKSEVPYPLSDHFACLHTVLEVPLEKLREAAVAVNALPREQRIPFVRIFLQALPPGGVAQELGMHVMEILENAKVGIASLRSQRINRLPGDDE